jgi:hypothetical protein
MPTVRKTEAADHIQRTQRDMIREFIIRPAAQKNVIPRPHAVQINKNSNPFPDSGTVSDRPPPYSFALLAASAFALVF